MIAGVNRSGRLLEGAGYQFLLGVALLLALYSSLQWRARLGEAGDGHLGPLGIVNLVFFVGTSAGAILVRGLAHALGVRRVRPLVHLTQLVAVGGLVLAAMFVLLDLARPARLAHADHVGVPLTWDVLIAVTYFLIVAALGYLSSRPDVVAWVRAPASIRRKLKLFRVLRRSTSPAELAWERRTLKRVATAALPPALLLYAISALILSAVRVRPSWLASLIAPLFVVPTLVSGLALWTVVAGLGRARLGPAAGEEAIRRLGRALFYMIPPLGLYLFGELLIVAGAAGIEGRHIASELLVGDYTPLVLGGFVGGLLLPFALLALPRTRTPRGIGLAAALVVAGVLVARWHLIVAGAMGHAHRPSAVGGYVPGWPELLYTAQAYALALLVGAVSLRGLGTGRRMPTRRSSGSA